MAIFNYTKPLTLEDLMKLDAGRIERSKDLKINKVEELMVTKKPSFLGAVFKKFRELFTNKPYEVLYRVLKYEIKNTKNNNIHNVIIKIPMHIDAMKLMKQKVEIYCDCADFCYRSAWYLNEHKNLFLNKRTEMALGVAITTQPTKLKPSVGCKHVYKAIEDLVDNYKKYLIVK